MSSRWTHEKLIEEFESGNQVALARVITLVENQVDSFERVLHDIRRRKKKTWRIGVTGPPGAGKSTAVEKLAALFREDGLTVGILAVDPSSPFSGGALLGDRVRMSALNLDDGVFIRSLATRGIVGGLTATIEEILHVMEAFGFEIIIIETVGVGQSEIDVASEADSVVVILVPESGDSIQILKSGLLEIAEILVVNKSDRQGADGLVADIEEVLEMRNDDREWREKIVQTTASEGRGIGDLKGVLEQHWNYITSHGKLDAGRRRRIENHVRRIIQRRFEDTLDTAIERYEGFDGLVDRILSDEESPYQVAEIVLREVKLFSMNEVK
jgi:LAO/AO transport system kinase